MDPATMHLKEENERLKRELQQLHNQREKEISDYESKVQSEREAGKSNQEVIAQRNNELEAMKSKMVRMTRQLDEEITRRDQVQAESQMLERKVQDLTKGDGVPAARTRSKDKHGQEEEQAAKERGSQVSTKLMRVVDQWMRQRDLQQALLRGASINDLAFSTLVQALSDCQSLQTLDLSQNLLTMDSCSDICQLITTAPNLSFLSLADNLFSLRSVGYFMTAVMERQNTKKLMPLDLLDLQGNEGLVAAAAAPIPDGLLKQVNGALAHQPGRLPARGPELVSQVMRALWRFLHDTTHPQVRDTSPDEVAFQVLDKVTIRKMENALMKILLLGAEGAEHGEAAPVRPVTANLAFVAFLEAPTGGPGDPQEVAGAPGRPAASRSLEQAPAKPTSAELAQAAPKPGDGAVASRDLSGSQLKSSQAASAAQRASGRVPVADPFSDLKAAFEPPKEKMKTFNLRQIVHPKNPTVIMMNMLERLLETTEIDARDMETDKTLLEIACEQGNMCLAKLCYRRGANLSAKTRKGDTPFNIVTRNKRYDLMEFLHTYGVKVNSSDAQGRTALHVAAGNDDVDAVCRLLEWGADVNIRDSNKRTPIHIAASEGKMKVTMLLLEVGADMNAKDCREYTAVAHAEANNHFALMDRLVLLGGKGHGLHQKGEEVHGLGRSSSAKKAGELVVSAGMLKSSSLGRIGKVPVAGMSGPLTLKSAST